MRKVITILAMFMSIALFGQSFEVKLSQDSVCDGDNLQATLIAEGTLATPNSTGNNQNGVMFDVIATNGVTITGFEANPLGTSDFYVYYRTGSFVGHENSATGWTLIDSSLSVPSGMGNLGFSNVNIAMVPGQTMAFYITSTGTDYMYYDNGTSVGNTLASDANIEVEEGVGKSYPFGNTYTTRNFVGAVLYEVAVTNIEWNISNSTNQSTQFSPSRSEIVSVSGEVNGVSQSASAPLKHRKIEVSATATPANIQAGQSSTLQANVKETRGLGTVFDLNNNQNGAMFDIEGKNNISITGFTIKFVQETAGTVEIYHKTGTHVGFEGNSNAWTNIQTKNVTTPDNVYIELNTPINIAPAQTMAFYITRTGASDYIYYSNGSSVGSTASSDENLEILEGTGVVYPFGTTYAPRVINAFVHYEIENPNNMGFGWSPGGGASASKSVSPNQTTTYTVTATNGGCSESADVTVNVAMGIEDEKLSQNLKVFPNPASTFVNVEMLKPLSSGEVVLTDLTGKKICAEKIEQQTDNVTLNIENLASGIYVLSVKSENALVTYKILKM